MTSRIQIIAGVILLFGSHHLALGRASDTSAPFAVANVHFERNATDGDFEVVFEVKGGDEGLAKLAVVSPDGRTVVDFTAPDASTLGIRQFRFESPEPADLASLRSAYPEGLYTFIGTSAAGNRLRSEATLNHKLPAPVSVLRPRIGAQNVGVKNLEISWTPVKGLAAYIIKIEQDELGVNIEARIPASVAKFNVPEGLLFPGKKYTLGIGTVTNEGNTSFIETSFTTGDKK